MAKKFISLEKELDVLIEEILRNPQHGEPLGNGLYKMRLAVESKNSGKSGGFRIVTYLINRTENSTDIFLITIYDKSEVTDVSKKELLKIVKTVFKK